MLLSPDTRKVAASPSRFLYYEVEVIRKLDLPVVFANLSGSRVSNSELIPAELRDALTLSVSFQPSVIKYALDDWVERYRAEKREKSGPYYYKASVYEQLGL